MKRLTALPLILILSACSPSAAETDVDGARILKNDENVLILQALEDKTSLEEVLDSLSEDGLITYISPVETFIPISLINDYYEEANTQRVYTTLSDYTVDAEVLGSDNVTLDTYTFEDGGKSITAGRTLASLSALPFVRDAFYVLEHSPLESQILAEQ